MMTNSESLEIRLQRALEHIDRLEKKNIQLEKALNQVIAAAFSAMTKVEVPHEMG